MRLLKGNVFGKMNEQITDPLRLTDMALAKNTVYEPPDFDMFPPTRVRCRVGLDDKPRQFFKCEISDNRRAREGSTAIALPPPLSLSKYAPARLFHIFICFQIYASQTGIARCQYQLSGVRPGRDRYVGSVQPKPSALPRIAIATRKPRPADSH